VHLIPRLSHGSPYTLATNHFAMQTTAASKAVALVPIFPQSIGYQASKAEVVANAVAEV